MKIVYFKNVLLKTTFYKNTFSILKKQNTFLDNHLYLYIGHYIILDNPPIDSSCQTK